MDETLAFVVLLLAGIAAGSEAGSYFFLRPAKSKLPSQHFIDLEKDLQASFGKIMPALMIVTTISILGLLLAFWSEEVLIKFLTTIGLLGFVIANGVTIRMMLPINTQTAAWNTKNLPDNWKVLRNKWEQVQGLRTWSMIVGFAALCAAVALQS